MSVVVPPEYLHFIDGKWTDSSSGKRIDVVNPATGNLLARVPAGNGADVDRAVAAAGKAFERWGKTSPGERQRILLEIASRIERRAADFAMLETLNVGKPIRESRRIDVPATVDHFRYFAGVLRHLEGHSQAVSSSMLHFTLREPLGPVAAIVPWNYPLLLATWKLAPALAAGNTVVLKPAEQTPLTVLELAKEVADLLPPGVFNVVTGYGPDAGAPLASHRGIRKVAFTGETSTGRLILHYAAENIVPATVELGGKSPQIVFPDADIDRAVDGAVTGICQCQGEVCFAGSRLFLHREVHDVFLEKLAAKMAALKVGDPTKEETEIGSLISREQLERVGGYIESGMREGARLVFGGTRPDDPSLSGGFFLTPALFGEVRSDMRIAREEIFGPVLSVLPWNDADAMIAEANGVAYGLAAGVWTRDLQAAVRTAKALQAGTVWINMYGYVGAGGPFGGYKESGFGRETAFETLQQYTQVKSVYINTSEKKPGKR